MTKTNALTPPPHRNLVPPMDVAKAYVSRDIGAHRDFEVFSIAMERSWNILLEGPTGAAKTMSLQAYAARHSIPFYSIPCNIGTEPSQIFGKYIPSEADGETFTWQDGGLPIIFRHGGVILFDEVNFTPPSVVPALYSSTDRRRELALLDHKGEVIQAHVCDRSPERCNVVDGFCRSRVLIVAACNPGYLGTRPLNAAFRNRFPIQLHWDYDREAEVKLVPVPELLAFAEHIRSEKSQAAITTPVSTNMLMELIDTIDAFGVEFGIANFIQHFAPNERPAIRELIDKAPAARDIRLAFDPGRSASSPAKKAAVTSKTFSTFKKKS